MMYGQMTAGSWIYIGTQGILQGTYETFGAAARKRFGGSLKGTLTLTAGLGGMGGAQPLAVTMNGGTCLAAEVDLSRVMKRIETRYLDKWTDDIDRAIDMALDAKERQEAVSVGVVANAADLYERIIERGIVPELVTDQTSSHNMLHGYVPAGMSLDEAVALREADQDAYMKASDSTVVRHVAAMIELQKRGSETFDYGNNIRAQAERSWARGSQPCISRFRSRLHQTTLLRRKGPVSLGRFVGRP